MMSARRAGRCALGVALTLGGLALMTPSSSAEESGASAFLFAFGGAGTAAGQFNVARGVAVDQASGDVYVADQLNQRVQEFTPWGGFMRMFGKEVNAGAPGDVCAAGESCQAGAAGPAGGQFSIPEGVAVDNSADSSKGDVYVVDFSNHRIEKFGPAGEFLLAFGKEVDATTPGDVCTAVSKDTCQAGKVGTLEDEFEWAGAVGSFIAVGSTGTVYVGDEGRVQEFASTGAHTGQILLPAAGKVTALAVDSGGDVYVAGSSLSGVHSYNPAGTQIGEFAPESKPVEAVALDPAGDLFVGTPEPSYHVTEYSQAGAQLASFTHEGLSEGSSTGIAANASGTVYVSEKAPPFEVLAFGKPPPGEPPPVAPSIDSESVSNLGVTSAAVTAQIGPHFLATQYYVQYGTDTSYSGGDVPAPPGTLLGGGEVQTDQPATVGLQGLTANTLYHYHFVAQSKGGTTDGPDQTFTTFSPALFTGLPDGRSYEEVSSQKKNGNEAGIELLTGGVPVPGYGVATAAGERMAFFQLGPSGQTSSGTDLYSVASRNPQTGWEVKAALPPGFGSNASNFVGEEPAAFMPSEDLSRFLFAATYSFQKENPDATESAGLYRAGTASPQEAEWWLSRPTGIKFSEAKPVPGNIQQKTPIPVGGSPTLGTAYFTWAGTLVPEDGERAKHVVDPGGDPEGPYGFYEWHEGALKSAGELPNKTYSPWGAVPAATTSGAAKTRSAFSLRNEVSKDGSKAFFVSPDPRFAGEPGASATELYVREQHEGVPATTALVSRNEAGKEAEGTGSETAVTPVSGSYVYAAPDGSRALFESRDKLTSAVPEGTGPWTYEFDLQTNKVTYLPGVVGKILTSSEDGSSFIFENTLTNKIELWSGGTAPVEVAGFSTSASPQFGAAEATSTGTVFAFSTNAVLSPGSFNNSAGKLQIYRFEPGASHPLNCVSCAPAGTAQSPVSPAVSGRTIADGGGRIFFATAEKLLPEDENGVEDVYEWEREGVGSCPQGQASGCIYLISSGMSPDPSFYLDNSESGGDVFIATREGLATGDTDGAYDVYDARIGGGFPTQAPSPSCGNECQTRPPQPIFGVPGGSAVFPGGETALVPKTVVQSFKSTQKPKPLTRAQKLAKALKACKSQPKRRRAQCVKQASRKYGKQAKTKSRKRGAR